jgi:uncharacterized protein
MNKPLNSILVKPAGPDCNMACTYCFYLEKSGLFPDADVHRMGEDILEEMVRQLLTQAGQQVSFGWQGGEPTLMGLPFFEKAVDFQQRFGRGQVVGNGLQTNGILIDKKWAGFLKKYDFLIGLSLDGPEHIHDHYRFLRGGVGSFAKVKDRAKLMLDAGVAVNALSTVNDHSVQFPEEIYHFHKELGLTFMQFIPIVEPHAEKSGEAAPFSVSAEQFGEFLCTLFDLWMGDFEDGLPTTSIRFFESVFHIYAGVPPPECTLQKECGTYVVVEHNGDVYACDFFVDPEWKLGNIMEGASLIEALNSERQDAFGRRKSRLPEPCKQCKWINYCRGGCPKDRIADPRDQDLNHFCRSFKRFFEHAHDRLEALALEWRRGQAMEEEKERYLQSHTPPPAGGQPGRNDPCPCGSGQKFKKCCGR